MIKNENIKKDDNEWTLSYTKVRSEKGSDPKGTIANKDGNAGLIRWGIHQ